MNASNFTLSFSVDQTAEEVVKAITNVRGWWTGDITGDTSAIGDEFTYRYATMHYSRQRVTALVPGERVAWHVLDAHLEFAEDPTEWTGTDITFEVAPKDDRTEVRFTHRGLSPQLECFDNCSNAWAFYLNGSLRRLITTGEGPTAPPWA